MRVNESECVVWYSTYDDGSKRGNKQGAPAATARKEGGGEEEGEGFVTGGIFHLSLLRRRRPSVVLATKVTTIPFRPIWYFEKGAGLPGCFERLP